VLALPHEGTGPVRDLVEAVVDDFGGRHEGRENGLGADELEVVDDLVHGVGHRHSGVAPVFWGVWLPASRMPGGIVVAVAERQAVGVWALVVRRTDGMDRLM